MTVEKNPTKWLPIESNPEVMNKFLYGLGLPKKWAITDVLSLDQELLDMLPQPVLAVLLCFPINDDKYKLLGEVDNDSSVYYLKQTISNACGTVAMIHSIANNLDRIELEDGFLKDFLNKTKDKTPAQRALDLEVDENVCNTHDAAAAEGQTKAPSLDQEVKSHFVTFVHKNNKLFELDGRKAGPLNIGNTNPDNFVKDAANACIKYMSQVPGSIEFSVVALTASE